MLVRASGAASGDTCSTPQYLFCSAHLLLLPLGSPALLVCSAQLAHAQHSCAAYTLSRTRNSAASSCGILLTTAPLRCVQRTLSTHSASRCAPAALVIARTVCAQYSPAARSRRTLLHPLKTLRLRLSPQHCEPQSSTHSRSTLLRSLHGVRRELHALALRDAVSTAAVSSRSAARSVAASRIRCVNSCSCRRTHLRVAVVSRRTALRIAAA